MPKLNNDKAPSDAGVKALCPTCVCSISMQYNSVQYKILFQKHFSNTPWSIKMCYIVFLQ